MELNLIIYFVAAFAVLAILDLIIYRVGRDMASCPKAPPGARVAALAVSSGYAAIGAGGVILAAIIVPVFPDASIIGLFFSLGIVSICLGLGFGQALANLRAVIAPNANPAS
jgi:hypothetical protein